MGTMKHFFPGGNTSRGFVNYFGGIIPSWQENKRIYVLKGGPGVGKNTFMHLFALKGSELGYDVEYFHCASDAKSFDAVRIPSLGVTMLDGTAPHVIDPVTPGAVDGIVNLGIYLNEDMMEKKRAEIMMLSDANQLCYKKTFAYLEAAGSIQRSADYLCLKSLHYGKLREEVSKIFVNRTANMVGSEVKARHLFASAITPQGYIDYFNTIPTKEKIIKLNGPGAITCEFIRLVGRYAEIMGYHSQIFDSPLLPEKPEHIIIDDLGICITTDQRSNGSSGEEVINLYNYVDEEKEKKNRDALDSDENMIALLINIAIDSLKESIAIHDEIEEIYKANMDFDRLNDFTNHFIEKIFAI